MLCGGASAGTEGSRRATVRDSAGLLAAYSKRELFQEKLPRPLVENQVVHTNEENVIVLAFRKRKTYGRLSSQIEWPFGPLLRRLDCCEIGSRRQHRRILEHMLRFATDADMGLTIDFGNPAAQCRMALQRRFQSVFNDALASPP